jgi:hypothetical protein
MEKYSRFVTERPLVQEVGCVRMTAETERVVH